MGPLSLPPGRRRLVAAAVVALLLVAVAWRHARHGVGGASLPLRVAPVVGSGSAAGAGGAGAGGSAPLAHVAPTRPIVVDVVGAVRRPGVYRLVQGDRVQDAVRRAGGLTRRADPVATNLAAPLSDGEQVVVGVRGAVAGGAAAGGTPGAATPSAPVSLSTASAEQLDALPGVGPVTAQKIVEYRQQHGSFTSVDELDAIPGIGPSRLHDLEGLVVP